MDIARYIGIPFKDHGRDYDGVDCHGLAYLFHRDQLNQDIPSYVESYNDANEEEGVSDCIERHINDWERVDDPQPGDIIIFNLLGWPCHVGIYLGGNDFLHCLKGTNSTVERLNSITWSRRAGGFIRWAPR